MTDVLPPNPSNPPTFAPDAAPGAVPAITAVPAGPQTLSLGPEDLSHMIELKQAMVERARGRAQQAALELQIAESDYALLQQMWQRATLDKPIKVQLT